MNSEKPIFNKTENSEEVASPQEIPSNKQELREFTRDYSPVARNDLAHKIKLLKTRRELGMIDSEEESKTIQALQDEFNSRFESQKKNFDKEAVNSRSVEYISKEKGLIFVHSIPLDGIDSEYNTQMNNTQVRTSNLTTEERIGMVINEQPSLSCSTIDLNKHTSYGFDPNKKTTMYPFGIVINKGIVLSANRFDAGTVALSRTAKHRKYDKNESDTSIQPKIDAQLEYAIHGPFSPDNKERFVKKHGHIDGMVNISQSNYNEVTISDPEVSGFYIDEDFIKYLDQHSMWGVDENYNKERSLRWKKIYEYITSYPDVPIYIKKDSQTKEFVFRDGKVIPINVKGTFTETEPSKKLGGYSWTNPEIKEVSSPIRISTSHISNLFKTHIPEYDIQCVDKIISSLKNKSVNEDDIYDAIKSDLGDEIKYNEEQRSKTKVSIAEKNDSTLFNTKTGMYEIYKKTSIALSEVIVYLADQIKSNGYKNLSERILEMRGTLK